jgi:hypothetical protein
LATKISSLYAEIGANTTSLKAGLADAKAGLTDTKTSMEQTTGASGNLSMAMMGLNQGVQLAEQAWAGLQKVYDATVGTTLALADRTKSLQNITGATAEQAGVLIAQFDDLGMSTDLLQRAFEAAVRKGYQPTIEGLQSMRDEYNKIQDPISQTKWLMDTFGRSGAQLAEYFKTSDASLQQMADSAQRAGVIMGQDGVEAAKAYKIQVSELNQQLQGLETTIGEFVIPGLKDNINWINNTIEADKMQAAAGVPIWDAMRTHTILMTALTNAQKDNVQETGFLNNALKDGINNTQGIIQVYKEAGPIWQGNTQQVENNALALGSNAQYTDAAGRAAAGLIDPEQKLRQELALHNSVVDPLNISIAGLNQQLANGAIDASQFASSAHALYNEMMGLLAIPPITLHLYQDYGASSGVKDPNASPFAGMAGGVGSGTSGTYVAPTTAPKTKVGNKGAYATGTDFVVPQGYYENYPIGYASSGERVQVTPATEQKGKTGNTYVLNIYGSPTPVNVKDEFMSLKAMTGGGV